MFSFLFFLRLSAIAPNNKIDIARKTDADTHSAMADNKPSDELASR
jgi:hypothetical protein